MLRATISKFKRACTLARIPRILRGEIQIPPCNFDKISAIFMKSKSTTSGSKDEEDEKCKKCKQLIELAFGPDPPEQGFEKIEVAKIPELHAENLTPDITSPETLCENDNRIAVGITMSKEIDTDKHMQNIFKTTTVDDDKFEQNVEIIKELPLFESIKRDKGICSDRTSPFLFSNKDSNSSSSGDINMLEMLAKQGSDTIDKNVLNEIEKLGISQQLLKDITNNSFSHKDVSTDSDKSKKNIPKPSRISEIDLETRVLEKDQTKMSERNFINRRAIKHLALHMGAEDISKDITNKSSEVKKKKNDEDSNGIGCETSNILIDDRRIRTVHEVPLDRRIRTDYNILVDSEKSPETKRVNNESPNVLTYDRHIGTSHENPFGSESSPKINKENVSSNTLTDDRHFRTQIKDSPLNRDKVPQIAREKIEWGNVNIKTYKEPTIATSENDNNEPAVLVKECQDYDCFIITPETPKAQTLTDQLIALNLKIQQAIAAGQTTEVGQLKEEEAMLTKEVERQKITKQMEKIFKDDRIPCHLFAHLTVVSKDTSETSGASKVAEPSALSKISTEKMVKNDRMPPHMFHDLTVLSRHLPKEYELKKAIQDFYEQEHDTELVKPDRLQYNSPNDDIVADKDYSLELDPRVVIRDFETQQPTYTEPYSPQNPNYYSNYFNNQGNMWEHPQNMQNMPPQNMPPPNPYNITPQNPYPFGGPQNMQFYNRAMASAVMPQNIANEMPSSIPLPKVKTAEEYYKETQPNAVEQMPRIKMPHAVSTSNASVDKFTENISTANINATNTIHDTTVMPPSTKNPNQKNAGPNLTDSPVILEENTNDLPNRVVKMKGGTSDKKGGTSDKKERTIKENLKRTIMSGLTPDMARFKVRSGSMDTPIKIKTDWRRARETYAKRPITKPAKHYDFKSKATVSPWIDKGAVTLKPSTSISAHSPENIQLPEIHPNMTLSEMLKNVRQRARLEMYQQFIMATPARKVKPLRGACKKPKPPCPPPQKTCPSSEPKPCPPPQCPPKPPPPPKPCKPACPDPCATPKCPPPAKKDPCAKCTKTERSTDIFGLVVTLGPMSKLSAVGYIPLNELTEDVQSNSLFMEEMLLSGTIPNSILPLTAFEDPLFKAVNDINDDIIIPDLLYKAFIFPKNYEPWTPIPSWPIPRKQEKRKLVCPQEGCKVRGPPPPGAPCNTIHHPCAGFPNDKKRT